MISLRVATQHQPTEVVRDGRKIIVCKRCESEFPCKVNRVATRQVLRRTYLIRGAVS